MLNSKGVRELAYVVEIDKIEPIVGSDNCEAAIVGGWSVMVRKRSFLAGDLAVYFEIDAQVDAGKPEFAFLSGKHGKIKTQKYTFGGKGLMISQGLLMAASDLDGKFDVDEDGEKYITLYGNDDVYRKGDFLTELLGVTYADAADNKRKANSVDKYKKMAARHPKLFRNSFIKKIYKTDFGKKVLFLFLGRKRDKKSSWPTWVSKTDEERIQNLVPMIPTYCQETWIATEKIDGTSTTFTLNGKDYRVCSRNICFDKPDKNCFYDTNVYLEMSEKYHMKEVLTKILAKMKKIDKNIVFVTIQGETYGVKIQNRDYSIKGHDFMAFNLIIGYKDGFKIRYNPIEMTNLLKQFDIPTVPIVDTHCATLPDTCEGILALAKGASALDGLPREGLVFRNSDGSKSFKAVDNDFILKYHK